MKAYSLDIRHLIVAAVDEGCTADEAAALFDLSPATVRRYLRQRRLVGDLTPKTSPGRPRLIRQADEPALLAQIADHPDGFLEEHRVLWEQQTHQTLSVATMCRALARLKLYRKKGPSTLKNKTRPSARRGERR